MDGTRSALIVASEQYTDPGLQRLRAPASDARALAAVLRDPAIGGFEVRTLLNEPAHVVNLAVEEFFADRQPADLLLMHFSGHGIKDQDGELYFAASNTVLGRLGATAVAAEFVNRRMTRSRSRRVVLLLDCCYAGAFERGLVARSGPELGIEQQLGGRGRAVITASSAMEYAVEAGELTGELAGASTVPPSVFTSALVQGLATGDADRDQNGLVGLDELYDYVYDQVRAATPSQTPGKWTFGMEGELYIARRARPVSTPAPLPPEVLQAIDSPLAGVRTGAVQELTALLRGGHAGRALAARLALEQLTRDDSRAVAAAAIAALAPAPQPAVLTPAPVQPPTAAPSRDDHPSEPRPRRSGRSRAAIAVGAVAVLAAVAAVVSIILISGKPPGGTTPVTPPRAGSVAWSFTTQGQIWSSPAVANGIVYFGSDDGNVYAVDARSHKMLWHYPTGGKVRSSPAVVDGVVYVGSDDGNVYALNATTGKGLWQYTTGNKVESSPAVAGGVVYVGSNDGDVYALRSLPAVPKTDRKVWAFPTYHAIRSGPVVVDNVVYFGSEDDSVYAVKTNDTLLWSHATGGWVDSNPTLTVVGGVVYFGSHDQNVYALNAANHALLWTYPTAGEADSRPAVAGNVVYVGSDDGNVYALRTSGTSVSRLWARHVGKFVVSGPAVAGGVVYVGSGNNNVYALDTATGQVRWSYPTGNSIFSSPVVSGHVVYIGSEDGKLYALNTGS
ncbi:MAG TPA: PQQ-binding-like beta-propeller repeat protein [Streptosporangiaceae bacterium]|nr:PQQ-binding-like beta-propeller repeat protein [Streptosporangiaceae bacterium]